MTVDRGNKHNYLGMTLDYFKEGACQISMFENLKSILETFFKLYKSKGLKKERSAGIVFHRKRRLQ